MSAGMELRTISDGRRFTTIAVIEQRRGRDPLRTEVVRNKDLDSYYCRACKSAEGGLASVCRHIVAARRNVTRPRLTLLANERQQDATEEKR